MIYNADVASAAGIVQSKLALNAWTAYTPSWTSMSNPQPALNCGTLEGRWVQLGKTVHGSVYFVAASNTTFGTSWWFFTLPTTSATGHGLHGTGYAENNAVTGYIPMVRGVGAGDNRFLLMYGFQNIGEQNGYGPTLPFTWADNDYFYVGFTYETS